MKKLFNEFKEFTLRTSSLNLAVGVIIGAAFLGIVKALIGDLLSLFLGLFLRTDFSSLTLTINNVQIRYGSFMITAINFLIMSFIIFYLIKLISKVGEIRKKEEVSPLVVNTLPSLHESVRF